MKDRELRHVMTAAVAAATPDMPVIEAHRLMRKHGVHHLPVTDADGKVKGIVSSSDLIKALMQVGGSHSADAAGRLSECSVSAVMSRDVICLPQTATLRDAARQLQTGAMHALPVVAPGDVLAGIITSTDLIEAMRRELDFSTSMPEGDTSDTSLSTWDSSASGTEQRLNVLEGLYTAIRHYLRSGRGEIEHARLVAAFSKARDVLEGSNTVL